MKIIFSFKTVCILYFVFISLIGNSQGILYQENFEGINSALWNSIMGLNVINENGNHVLKVDGSGSDFGAYFWDNYRFSVHAKLSNLNDNQFFLKVRSSIAGNYELRVFESDIVVTRIRYPGPVFTRLAEIPINIGFNTWHIYNIELANNNFKLYCDNELIININDNEPLLVGQVGFGTPNGSEAYFDNILVTADRVFPKQEFPWIGTGGPIGGMGYDVRIHPLNHDIMFVTDIWSGLHKSYNGGKTWNARNKGIDFRNTPTNENKFGPSGDATPIYCVTIDPTNPDIVWCGTNGYRGIYKSTDCGESWTKMVNGIPDYIYGITFRSFAVDPNNSEKVFAACEIGTGKDECLGAIFRTIDGGKNWVKILDSQSLVRIILIDPRNTKVLFASTGIFDRGSVKEEGIMKSTDGGITWFHANNGINSKALSIEGLDFYVDNPDIMYSSTGRGPGFNRGEHTDEGAFYRSDDAGKTWKTVFEPLPGKQYIPFYLAISKSDPDIVYVGSSGLASSGYSLLRTMDGGKTWKELNLWTNGIRGGIPISVTVHPDFPNIVFLNFYGGGVIKTTDFGETWNLWSNGYTGASIVDLTIDASDPSTLYASSLEGVSKSINGGKDWIGMGYGDLKNMPGQGPIQINPKNSQTVIVGRIGQNVLCKTTDGGYNWHDVLNKPPKFESDGTFVSSISWSQSDTNEVFASFHLTFNMVTSGSDSTSVGIFKSEDAGNTWFALNNGFEQTKKNALTIEVHPKNSNIVFCSLSGEGVYRSTDGGANWIKKNNGIINFNVKSFVFDPIEINTIYAGIENGGIFKSVDMGESWTQITRGMDPEASIRSIVINPQNHMDIFAHDWATGVYRSTDGGKQWNLFNKGLTTRAGQSLAISNDGKVLYAGTLGAGVFRVALAEFKTKVYEVTPDTSKTIRVKKGDTVEFMVDAYDFNTDTLKYSWWLNNSVFKNQDSTSFKMKTDTLAVGKYLVSSKISDKDSSLTVKWKVEIYSCANNTKFENVSICQGQNYNGWTTSGTYMRTLHSFSGCDSIVSTNLTVITPLIPNIFQHGDTLIADKQYGTYQWCDESGIITGATQNKYVIKKGGNYFLFAKDSYGCLSKSDVFNAIHSEIKISNYDPFRYSVYPNPGNGQFTLKIDSSPEYEFFLKLINPIGQVLETRQIISAGINHEEQFDISYLSKGIYFLIISSVKYQICEKIIVH